MTEEVPVSETGYQVDSSLLSWGSLVAQTHETNPDLQWPQSVSYTHLTLPTIYSV